MKIWFPAMAGMWSSLSVFEVILGEESSVVHFSSVRGTSLANTGSYSGFISCLYENKYQ
jgi:hypothetical protein